MQEPESNEMIQAGTMKALTGGDRISTRELHSSQMEFKPHAKFFMCCNTIPSISDIDGGVIRRLKITEFISRFVDNPDPSSVQNGIHEYKIDKDLKSKLDAYKTVFMCILLDYYKLYKRDGLIPPEPVMSVTLKYESDNNTITQFIDEHITVGTKHDSITKEQLKEIYKSDSSIRNSFGKFTNFCKKLENSLCCEFKPDKKKIYRLNGWKIRNVEIDDDDDESI
jgi:phage/plasmid-associated DNA primase